MAKKSKAQREYERARNTLTRWKNRLSQRTGIKLAPLPVTPRQAAKASGQKKLTAAMYRAATKELKQWEKAQRTLAKTWEQAQKQYKAETAILKAEYEQKRAEREQRENELLDVSEAIIEQFCEMLKGGEGGEVIINAIRSAVAESSAIAVASALQDAADAGYMVTWLEYNYEEYANKYLEHFGRYWRERRKMSAKEWFFMEQRFSQNTEGVDFELQ